MVCRGLLRGHYGGGAVAERFSSGEVGRLPHSRLRNLLHNHVLLHTFAYLHGRRQKFFQGGANQSFCHKPSVTCKFVEGKVKRRIYCQQKLSKRAKNDPRNSRVVAVLACRQLIPAADIFLKNGVLKHAYKLTKRDLSTTATYPYQLGFSKGGASARIAHVWRRP